MNKHVLRMSRFLTIMFGIVGWFLILHLLSRCIANGGIVVVNANAINEMYFEFILSILIIIFILSAILIEIRTIWKEESV